MRNLTVILEILMMAVAFAIPAYAMGGGMGGGGMGGGGMMGSWGSGTMGQGGRGYGNQPDRGREQMQELDTRFYEESANVKAQIQTKETELDTLLNSPKPDIGEVKALHSEVNDLRAKLAEEQRNYDLEAARINSGHRSDNGDGWSSDGPGMGNGSRGGMGYGGQMGDYGSGR
jgi:Spy/CpxP family protein refolding chaperone